MRSIIKALQRKNELSIEGRWEDLEQHFKRASKTYRPFVWLFRRCLLPGTQTTQYALFLYKQGRLEEALVQADRAIQQIAHKPIVFSPIYHSQTKRALCSTLLTRTLILTGLGRYDEAREASLTLQQMTASSRQSNVAMALLEYYCGHLDKALELAEAVPPQDKQYDTMRGIIALAHSMKGEVDKAIQALSYEPSDISKYYSPESFSTVSSTADGAKLIELQRKKHAGVFQPARLILLAHVHLTHEDIESAIRALDQAEKVLGPEPAGQAAYCRHRACSLAAQGKGAEAEAYIERMRAIAKQVPSRSLLWETHVAACRSYLYLEQFDAALAEAQNAQQSALHPIEKHGTAYLTARIHEAAGHEREAVQSFEILAADSIPSWMRRQALETLARQRP